MSNTSSFATTRSTYQAALISLFHGSSATVESDLAALFTPDFTQHDDDTAQTSSPRDYTAWVHHVRWLREQHEQQHFSVVGFEVVQFVVDAGGRQVAERHVSATRMKDGRVFRAETFQFVDVAEDGRICRIVETVRPRGEEKVVDEGK
jgi:ketosteroid isomerase-like protein